GEGNVIVSDPGFESGTASPAADRGELRELGDQQVRARNIGDHQIAGVEQSAPVRDKPALRQRQVPSAGLPGFPAAVDRHSPHGRVGAAAGVFQHGSTNTGRVHSDRRAPVGERGGVGGELGVLGGVRDLLGAGNAPPPAAVDQMHGGGVVLTAREVDPDDGRRAHAAPPFSERMNSAKLNTSSSVAVSSTTCARRSTAGRNRASELSSKEHKYSDRNTDGGTDRASLRRNSESSRCTRVQGTSILYHPADSPASHACQYQP